MMIESLLLSFFLYFSVANGEPPIGIPWETFQKYIRIIIIFFSERSDILWQMKS